jgi:hypothetical protein
MIYSAIIPLGLLFVPWLLVRFVFTTTQTRDLPYLPHALYLVAASALWLLALMLPNVPISQATDSTTMHFMGGVVATVLFIYVVKVYGITFMHSWQAWIALYLFVSGLGVLNELLELFLDETRIMPMPRGDEWWDLLANTAGGLSSFALLRVFHKR